MFDRSTYRREYHRKTRRDAFYILTHSEAPHVCKPGSSGWVRYRQQSVRGAFPFGDISVAYELETPHYRTIEKIVKAKFKDKALNGDWLDVRAEEVIHFVSTLPLLGVSNAEQTSQLAA